MCGRSEHSPPTPWRPRLIFCSHEDVCRALVGYLDFVAPDRICSIAGWVSFLPTGLPLAGSTGPRGHAGLRPPQVARMGLCPFEGHQWRTRLGYFQLCVGGSLGGARFVQLSDDRRPTSHNSATGIYIFIYIIFLHHQQASLGEYPVTMQPTPKAWVAFGLGVGLSLLGGRGPILGIGSCPIIILIICCHLWHKA